MHFHYFVIISAWKRAKGGALHLNKFESPYPRCIVSSLVKLAQQFSRRRCLKFVNVFFFCYFVIISPWIKVGTFIWKNLGPYHPLLQVWLKFDQWFWWRRFVNFVNVFSLFHYKLGPFIWTNLNPFQQRMLSAWFAWNWISGSGEEDFLISSMYF